MQRSAQSKPPPLPLFLFHPLCPSSGIVPSALTICFDGNQLVFFPRLSHLNWLLLRFSLEVSVFSGFRGFRWNLGMITASSLPPSLSQSHTTRPLNFDLILSQISTLTCIQWSLVKIKRKVRLSGVLFYSWLLIFIQIYLRITRKEEKIKASTLVTSS